MGLCKCPKRKVTNLFCFEHRVNVCEHCLVSNHPRCIVQSYLQWLQDSDYDPNCPLCQQTLTEGDVVRLVCYDVFHWSCLNQYAQQLPANTAPAGYTCPKCKTGLFPAKMLVSPIADSLRQHYLTQVNWARAGLGLPLIEEPPAEIRKVVAVEETDSGQQTTPMHGDTTPQPATQPLLTTGMARASGSVAIPVEDVSPHTRADRLGSTPGAGNPQMPPPRKVYDSTVDDKIVDISHDHDVDKYRRRSALEWFTRWFNSRDTKGPQRRKPASGMKKFLVVLVIGLIGFFTLIIFMSSVGRRVAEGDPFLDPMANPNIRVGRVPQLVESDGGKI